MQIWLHFGRWGDEEMWGWQEMVGIATDMQRYPSLSSQTPITFTHSFLFIFCGRVEINCGHPGRLWNGWLENIEGGTGLGASIIFRCHEGMRLEGNSSTVCQIEGKWRYPLPKCLGKYSRFACCFFICHVIFDRLWSKFAQFEWRLIEFCLQLRVSCPRCPKAEWFCCPETTRLLLPPWCRTGRLCRSTANLSTSFQLLTRPSFATTELGPIFRDAYLLGIENNRTIWFN